MSNPDSPVRRNAAQKRRQMIIIGITASALIAIAMGGLFLFDTGVEQIGKAQDKGTVVNIAKPGTVQDSEAWRATQAVRLKEYEEALRKSSDAQNELKSKLEGQEKQFEALRLEMDALRRGQTPLPSGQVPVATMPRPQGAAGTNPATGPLGQGAAPMPASPAPSGRILQPPPSHGMPFNQPLPDAPRAEMEVIAFDARESSSAAGPGLIPAVATPEPRSTPSPAAAPAERAEPQAPRGKAGDFIPANTFVRAVMLNGVDAPTGGQGQGLAGNPHPIHFHITDFANLPNLRRLNVTDCRVMAAATGDISSERVIARIENLTCVLPSGQAIEMAARGHIIGEDGKYGIRGRLISKQGQVIASQILAEFARGIGNGLRQAATLQSTSALGVTSTIDNSRLGQAALGSGLAGGANALANYYTNLANKLFPVIEADAGRQVEIVFSQGVQMPGSLDAAESSLTGRRITRTGAVDEED